MDKKVLYKVLASLGVIGAGYYGYQKVMGDKPKRITSLDDFIRTPTPEPSGGYYYSYEFWGEPQTQETGVQYSISDIALVDLDLIRKILNKPPKELSRNDQGLIDSQQAEELNRIILGFDVGSHTDRISTISKWGRNSIASLDDINSKFDDNAVELQAATSSAVRELILKDPQSINKYGGEKRVNAGVMYFVRNRFKSMPVEYRLIEIGNFTIKDSQKIFQMIIDSLNS